MFRLLRGFRGHPVHPPLTDAVIGSYTVGVIAALLGLLGFEQSHMAPTAVVAIGFGLVLTVPAAVTGFADYLQIERGTPLWRTALFHMIVNLVGAAVFALSLGLLFDSGYNHGTVDQVGAIAAFVAYGIQALGGWLGGSLVFVHGMRVEDKPDMPAMEAALPKDAAAG